MVQEKIWSDHLPIELKMKIRSIHQQHISGKLLPKLQFKYKSIDQYQTNIQKILLSEKQNKVQFFCKDLTEIIKAANDKINTKNKSTTNFVRKQKWFNIKCFNARSQSFKSLRKFKKSNDDQDKMYYVDMNKKFKDICKEEEIKYQTMLDKMIDECMSAKDWWKIAEEIRGEIRDSTIGVGAAELKDYFKNLLNIEQTSRDIHYAFQYHEDIYLNSHINQGQQGPTRI